MNHSFIKNWFAWVHLQSLINFKESGAVNIENTAWLDKEISELEHDLGIEGGTSHGTVSEQRYARAD